MAWWMAIPAVLSLASSLSQSFQQSGISANQAAWDRYNAQMGYNNAFLNVRGQLDLARVNAAFTMRAASAAASAQAKVGAFNAAMIRATAQYNDLLFEQDLALLWDQNELDLQLIEKQRMLERGGIRAAQAASGTVMDVGSNADVIISQKTEEAFESFVVKHGAEVQASKIWNARSQSLWNAEVKARSVAWEGSVAASVTMANAAAQAGSGLAGSALSGFAQLLSAESARTAGMYQAGFNQAFGQQQARNTLVGGIFNSASQGISAYYNSRVPTISTQSTSLMGSSYSSDPQSDFWTFF